MNTLTEAQVREAVAEAVAEAKAGTEGGGRLLPFTEPEIRFIQRIVEGALERLVGGDGA